MAFACEVPGEVPTRWAIVVGVDQYHEDDPRWNLHGCCNDAVLMFNFFSSDLRVPQHQILLHLARNRLSSAATETDPPSKAATYWGFRKSLEIVSNKARPGDHVYIHFSGHGNREPTTLPEEKGSMALDERLCFTDNEMTDHELGLILDEMASSPRSLVVFVSLDCCFSGGATRWGKEWAVRCKPPVHERVEEPPSTSRSWGYSEFDPSSENLRHADWDKGWIYRDRGYNVIAACQPNEKAREGRISDSGLCHGALTPILVSCFKNLGYKKPFTTYAEFQARLETTLKTDLGKDTQQQPILLGPRNRVVFEAYECNTQIWAHVKSVENDRVVIDRGETSQVHLQDVYCLFHPSKVANPTLTFVYIPNLEN